MGDKANRVLSRRGARILSREEVEKVNGAALTQTAFCTRGPNGKPTDGDIHDC